FAETFRMGGHATHDEKEARDLFPAEVFEHWGKRDPVGLYESYLERHGVERPVLEEIEQRVIEEIAAAEKEALESRDGKMPDPRSVTQGVFAGPDEARPERC